MEEGATGLERIGSGLCSNSLSAHRSVRRRGQFYTQSRTWPKSDNL